MSVENAETRDDTIVGMGPARREVIWLLCQLIHHILRIAMRHQVLVPEMERLLRWQATMLALHHREFAMPNRRRQVATASHAAVVTGLGRREVADVSEFRAPPIEQDGGNLHRLIRIVTAWSTEPEYQRDGKPVDLPLSGEAPSLHALNQRFGRCVPDRAMADWLVQNGNAEWMDDPDEQWVGKRLRWVDPVISTQKFCSLDISILGQIGSDFLHSLQQSADPRIKDQPRFRETYFNDIPADRVDELHRELKEQVQQMCKTIRETIQAYRVEGCTDGRRVGVGLYTFKDAPLVDKNDGLDEEVDQ